MQNIKLLGYEFEINELGNDNVKDAGMTSAERGAWVTMRLEALSHEYRVLLGRKSLIVHRLWDKGVLLDEQDMYHLSKQPGFNRKNYYYLGDYQINRLLIGRFIELNEQNVVVAKTLKRIGKHIKSVNDMQQKLRREQRRRAKTLTGSVASS